MLVPDVPSYPKRMKVAPRDQLTPLPARGMPPHVPCFLPRLPVHSSPSGEQSSTGDGSGALAESLEDANIGQSNDASRRAAEIALLYLDEASLQKREHWGGIILNGKSSLLGDSDGSFDILDREVIENHATGTEQSFLRPMN